MPVDGRGRREKAGSAKVSDRRRQARFTVLARALRRTDQSPRSSRAPDGNTETLTVTNLDNFEDSQREEREASANGSRFNRTAD